MPHTSKNLASPHDQLPNDSSLCGWPLCCLSFDRLANLCANQPRNTPQIYLHSLVQDHVQSPVAWEVLRLHVHMDLKQLDLVVSPTHATPNPHDQDVKIHEHLRRHCKHQRSLGWMPIVKYGLKSLALLTHQSQSATWCSNFRWYEISKLEKTSATCSQKKNKIRNKHGQS